tara:strand:+ start:2215 stop:2610 length:396 start_codon:yes stop_codon:yes gene_type:complete
MSCFSGKKQEKRIRRKYKVHPELVKKTRPSVYDKPVKEIGEMIGREQIKCGVCSQIFSLSEGKIVGSCVGCDRFLHCGIAGKCIGEDCKYIIHGKECRATWCLSCVPIELSINQTNNNIDGDCICKNCSKK